MNVDWLALLNVSLVTVGGAVVVVAMMTLANWCLTPVGDAETAVGRRRVAGYAVVGLMGLVVLGGIVLIIPYFH